MKLLFLLTILSAVYIITSCAAIPTGNPWEYPNRGYSISSSAEQAQLFASMQPCAEFARDTFPEAVRRYESGLLEGAGLTAMVFDDDKFTSQLRVHTTEGDLINGRMSGRHIIKGKFYAGGDKISIKKPDIVDWYIVHRDRPPEGNIIGKYMLLKQDGLAPGDCDPSDVEFQRYRYFSKSYSLVPPGTIGWEMTGPSPDAEMIIQKKDENLDEINTLSSEVYRLTPNKSDQELIELARSLGRYGDEEGVRYNVVKLEAEIYPHRQARCARSLHIVEDKQALLSKSGKRGFMVRDVQSLVCVHPADEGVAVVLRYSHRHHPGKRDPGFNDRANRVFESLAFASKGPLTNAARKPPAPKAEKETPGSIDAKVIPGAQLKIGQTTNTKSLNVSGSYRSDITSNTSYMFQFKKHRKLIITLKHVGNKITGFDKSTDSEITGTLAGDTIKFKFWSKQIYAGGEASGEWKVIDDGKRIEGFWGSAGTGSSGGKWNLTRIE